MRLPPLSCRTAFNCIFLDIVKRCNLAVMGERDSARDWAVIFARVSPLRVISAAHNDNVIVMLIRLSL